MKIYCHQKCKQRKCYHSCHNNKAALNIFDADHKNSFFMVIVIQWHGQKITSKTWWHLKENANKFMKEKCSGTYPGYNHKTHINGLVQDCSNSTANALALLQLCAKPVIWSTYNYTSVSEKPTTTTVGLHLRQHCSHGTQLYNWARSFNHDFMPA